MFKEVKVNITDYSLIKKKISKKYKNYFKKLMEMIKIE